jgi:hypothetical protein
VRFLQIEVPKFSSFFANQSYEFLNTEFFPPHSLLPTNHPQWIKALVLVWLVSALERVKNVM